MYRPSTLAVVALGVAALTAPPLHAQLGDLVKQKVKAKAQQSNAPGAPVASAKPGEGAWANYDFVPGERVLFFEDFTKDTVGDFPRRLEFKRGNLEVVDWQGGRYLRTTVGNGEFYIPLPEVLP